MKFLPQILTFHLDQFLGGRSQQTPSVEELYELLGFFLCAKRPKMRSHTAGHDHGNQIALTILHCLSPSPSFRKT